MATQLRNHLAMLELAVTAGATSPDPGGKSIIWSTTEAAYLGWTGSSWEVLAVGSGGTVESDVTLVQAVVDPRGSGVSNVLTFASDVTNGNVIVVAVSAFVNGANAPSAYTTGDLTKTGGTATISDLTVDLQHARTSTSEERVAFLSMLVTGSGSLELTLASASGDYQNAVAFEYNGIETVGTRVGATNSSDGAGSGGSLLMSAGSVSSTGKGVMLGAFGCYTSGTSTWSHDGAFSTPSGGEEGNSAYNASAVIYRLLSGATTDSPEATNSDVQTPGWSGASIVYKAAVTGSSGGSGGLTQAQVLARGLGA